MKLLEIKKMEFEKDIPTLDEISDKLDKLDPKHFIDNVNWNDFPYKPDVRFSVGYTSREILLKYYITEQYFKAEKTKTNEMVCEDSCVEFFVSPVDDGIYYNFEFNGIGTCLLGKGTGREDSKRVDPGIISMIRRQTSAGKTPVKELKGPFSWTITIAIPIETFFHYKIKELKGNIFRANFYKCGDMLSVPHFVTWNPVGTDKPDYHRPEYFGAIKFI